MTDDADKHGLAIRVAAATLGGAAGIAGPEAAMAGAAITPVLEEALGYLDRLLRQRRFRQAAQTVEDGAEAYGAETSEEWAEFVRATVSDPEHQELLARALTIAQDTAIRDKRRAPGRALASAASEAGARVDDELLFIRVLADLDAWHIRCLSIMRGAPPRTDQDPLGMAPRRVHQWRPSEILDQDPGLEGAVWAVLPVLAGHGLISRGNTGAPDPPVALGTMGWAGLEPEYVITGYGEFMLDRLAEPMPLIPDQD